jgi:hypothetical protein
VQTLVVVDERRRGREFWFGPRFGVGGLLIVGCFFVERSRITAKERTASSDELDIPIVDCIIPGDIWSVEMLLSRSCVSRQCCVQVLKNLFFYPSFSLEGRTLG